MLAHARREPAPPPDEPRPPPRRPRPPPAGGRYALLVVNDKHIDPVYAGMVAPLDETLGLEGVLTARKSAGSR